MIVCLCRGICERTIQAMIAAGASTADEIAAACGAGTDCGACCGMLEDLVQEEQGAPA